MARARKAETEETSNARGVEKPRVEHIVLGLECDTGFRIHQKHGRLLIT